MSDAVRGLFKFIKTLQPVTLNQDENGSMRNWLIKKTSVLHEGCIVITLIDFVILFITKQDAISIAIKIFKLFVF